MSVYVFDDLFSIIHFLLGFIVGLLRSIGLSNFATLITLVYILYERLESDNVYMIGDFVEFLLGVLFAELLVSKYANYLSLSKLWKNTIHGLHHAKT